MKISLYVGETLVTSFAGLQRNASGADSSADEGTRLLAP